ncbi:MAG TPA: FG-GAP-like repeat-containing protein [Flavobacteriaceae bacterium]|nr:FG-GAP-like repeat-containing protein [Flavobacteriaceae bacterium]
MKKTTTIATLLISLLTLATFPVQAQLVITSTSPAQNENNVPRNANIDVVFLDNSGIVDVNTIDPTTYIVTGSQTGPISGTFNGSSAGVGETYTFYPSTDFKAGEIITVTLTTDIQTYSGTPLSGPYTFSFTADVNPALEDPAFFEAATIENTGDRASGLYVVDVDDDGDMDVLASFLDETTHNDAPYSVTWYENNGSQSFVVRSITNSATAPLRAHDVHAGDMDGDGDVDILSADDNGVYWYESDGNANPGFTDHEISGAEGGARDMYVADVDSDGDMDVLRAFYLDDTIAWYENDGNVNPGFTYRTLPAVIDQASSVHAADVDGDGDMDVLSASESDDNIGWFENDGNSTTPGFTHHIIHNGFGGNNTRKVYSGDVDGDLDMDVLFGHGSTLDWLENTGGGSFGSPQNITSSANTIVDISMSDVDGDGDMDVLSASFNDNTIAWYENNGNTNPGFTAHNITTLATNAAAVYAADLDGDLDMDVLSGTSFGDGKVTWYENKAAPPVITAVTPTPNSIGNLVNTDITLVFDHPIDNTTLNNSTIIVRGTRTGLVGGSLSGGGTNTITFNPTNDFEAGERITVTLTTGLLSTDGLAMDAPYAFSFLAAVASPPESPPVFYPKVISTTADGAREVYVADLDGDGDMDVLSASENDDTIAWYENNGSGHFGTGNNITSTADGAYAVYAADVDSDGDMDVLSASKNDDTIAWYANNGSGSFGAEQIISTGANGAHDVYAIDVDSDGDMDVVSASENDDDITLYENNGSQSFSVDVIENFADDAHSVYAADVDGDRDMDLLSAWGNISGGSIDWYENGLGFSDRSYSVQSAQSVFAGDMDGDGDMDMLLASDFKINWYENDGQADPGFNVHQIDAFGSGRSVYATDMDGDSDLDVLSVYGNTVAWYENGSSGNFSAEKIITTTASNANSVYAADMDGDGDMDVLSASTNDDTIAWYESDDTVLTLYVDGNSGNDSNTGESWAQAFQTLTKALSEADGRDQIWVAEGTYFPDEGFGATNDDRNASFTVTGAQDGLEIYGGFAGTETQLNQRDPGAHPVILNGDIDGDGTATGNSYHVFSFDGTTDEGGITLATVLDGLTITNGNADGSSPDNRAGGIYLVGNGNGNECSPRIVNTVFVNNSAEVGGAIYCYGAGGISSPAIVNSIFTGNTTTLIGGAIQTSGNNGGTSSPVVANSIFIFNHSDGDGGAIHNSAVNSGTSATQISNSIFWGNTATDKGNQIYNNDANPTLDNTIIEGGLTGIFNNGSSGTTDGGGNLSIDPQFVNIGDPDGADNNFGTADDGLIPQTTGPAINAGSNTAYTTGGGNLANDVDLAGNPRVYDQAIGGIIDIGAYEYQETPIFPSTNNIIYVNTNVTGGSNNGSSWANALPELADALKYARIQTDAGNGWDGITDSLQIYVAIGTYKPRYDASDGQYGSNGNRDNAFVMVKNVQVYGGFDPANNIDDLGDVRIPPSPSGTGIGSILSGDIGTQSNNFDNTYHVVMGSGALGSVLLDGFAITKGNADGSAFNSIGGGILLLKGGDKVMFKNLIVTGNEATSGAVAFYGDNTPIGSNTPVMVNCLIYGNITSNSGVFYAFRGMTATLVNCTIANNQNNGSGANAIRAHENAIVNLKNSIVFGNTGGTNTFNYTGSGTQEINLFYSLTDAIAGTDDFTDGGNNIFTTTDPFVNIASNDHTLSSGSAAIDAGNNSFYTGHGNTDLAGINRILGSSIDIGAYEHITGYVYNNGSWTPSDPSGAATSTDDILVVNGTTSLIADTQMNDLIINSGATLKIDAVLSPSGIIENNGILVFVSDGTKLGQLDDMTGSTITGSGEVTVQRHIPKRNDSKGAWRYLSSAVNSSGSIHANWQEGATGIGDNPNPGFGMFITGSTTGADGFDQTASGAPSMYTFDEATQSYVFVPNTDVGQLIAGQDYVAYVWGDRSVDIITTNDPLATTTTLQATGNLVTGNQSFAGSSVAGEFNLTGNPYQAIVDMTAVLANSTNLNPNIYYVWDPNLGTRGAYATVDLAGTSTLPSTSKANQYLQPGQAAWTVTAAAGAATVLFEESDKDVLQTPTDVFRPQNVASIELQLFQQAFFANNGPLSDAVRVNFSKGESNAVLPNDAPKLWNYDETIALVNGNEYLAIGNRALPTNWEILQLHNDQYRVSGYVFKALANGFADNVTVYLKDDYLGIQSPLNNNGPTLINFSVDETVPASIAPNRFSIVFAVGKFSTEGFSSEGFVIYPNPVENGEFHIVSPKLTGEELQIAMYNVLGQSVYQKAKKVSANGRTTVETHGLEAGVYLVEITYNGRKFVEKVIVQ